MRQFLFISMIFIAYSSYAQQGYTYGGADDDVGHCFTFNEVGGYVLAAAERTAQGISEEFSIRSIDKEGNLIWKRTYGHKHHETPYHIERTSDQGYILVGHKWDGGYGRLDAYIMKLNGEGEEQWTKYHGGWHRDEGFSIKETSDGGFIMAGMTKSDDQFSFGQMYVIKMDQSGNEIWAKDFGGSGKDFAFDVIEDSQGNFVVAGEFSGFYNYSTFEFTEDHSDILVYKLDPNGNVIWSQQYGGAENELGREIMEAPQGGYYIFGSTQSTGSGSFDMYLFKIDYNGVVEWERVFGDAGFDYGESMTLNGDYLFLAGSTNNDPNSNKTDIYMVRVDATTGFLSASWTYGTSESEYGHFVRGTSDGGCAVIGKQRTGTLGDQVLFLKFAFNGDVEVLDGSDDNTLLLFPNPSSDYINIYYQEGNECYDYGYKVYDMFGNLVYDQVKYTKFVQLDVSEWAGGEYHLKVTSSCADEMTRRIIVSQ